MTQIINLTPHPVNIRRADGTPRTTRDLKGEHMADDTYGRVPNNNNAVPLIIDLGLEEGHITPQSVIRRIWAIRRHVLKEVWCAKRSTYARIARTSAQVEVIFPGGKVKHFVTARTEERQPRGILVTRRRSARAAWTRTMSEVSQAFNEIVDYAQFAILVDRAVSDPRVELPEEHPSGGWARFVKPLFGTQWRDRYDALQKLRRQLPAMAPNPTIEVEEEDETAIILQEEDGEIVLSASEEEGTD